MLIRGAPLRMQNASHAAFRQAFANITARLARTRKHVEVQSRIGHLTEEIQTTFGDWADNLGNDDANPYIFQMSDGPAMRDRIEATYGIPPLMRETSKFLFIASGKEAKDAGIPLHNHYRTWAASMAGTKLWYVAPPNNLPIRPNIYHHEQELESAKLLRCSQEQGDIVYLPAGWWHATFNKGDWVLTVGGQEQSEGTVYDAAAGDAAALRLGNVSVEHLSAAAGNGHTAVLELLSTKGVNLSSRDKEGLAPAHAAARHGHKAVLELLSTKGVKLSSKCKGGLAPAHAAAGNGHKAVLEFLSTKGVNLSSKDKGGRTTAHYAARNGHKAVLEFLSTKGVNLSSKDKAGHAPAHYAAGDGHTAVSEFLSTKGVTLSSKGKRGQPLSEL